MTARLNITPKTTEQNRIVHTGKFEVEVTNNKKTALVPSKQDTEAFGRQGAKPSKIKARYSQPC